MFIVFPEIVAGPETIEKVTGKPELAVADISNGLDPNFLSAISLKFKVCEACNTLKVCSALTSSKLLFPACDAFTTTVPAPVSVIIFPEIVAGPEIIEKVIGRPELAVAEIVNGIAPKVLSVISLKISVCLAAFATELEILNVLFDRPTISSCDPVSEILILHSSVKSLILKLPLCLSFCPVFGIALPGTVH